jgi:hypothetical protein
MPPSLITLSLASEERIKRKTDAMRQSNGEKKLPIETAGTDKSVATIASEHKQFEIDLNGMTTGARR